MDKIELEAKKKGIETYKIGEDVYVSMGCFKCKPESIVEYCKNCKRLYVKDFEGLQSFSDVNVTISELYKFLAMKDKFRKFTDA